MDWGSFTLVELSTILVWLLVACCPPQVAGRKVFRSLLPLLLMLMTAGFFSVFQDSDAKHAASVYRDFVLPVVFLLGFLLLPLGHEQVLFLIKLFILGAAACSILALVQFATDAGMWTANEQQEAWQEFKAGMIRETFWGRLLGVGHTLPVGLSSATNNLASFLIFPAAAVLPLCSDRVPVCEGRRVWRLSFCLMTAALVVSCSRGPLLTVIAAALCFRWLSRAGRVTAGKLVSCALMTGAAATALLWTGLLSWDALGTGEGRLEMAGDAVDLIRSRPAMLMAGGVTGEYQETYHRDQVVHNSLLYIILQFGLPALILSAWIVLSQVRQMLRGIGDSDSAVSRVGLAVLCGVTVNLLLFMQTTSFFDSVQASFILYFWIGLGVHLCRPQGSFRAPDDFGVPHVI